jgi:enoyl-CoA hydratase/carnithine racemase
MNAGRIEVEIGDGVAQVRLDNPQQLNAITGAMVDELTEALRRLETDDRVRAVVVSGTGRAFCSGYDIAGGAEVAGTELRHAIRRSDEFMRTVWSFPKPTVAAVHGYALGGGCELSIACDITVAARSAMFGEPEIRFGGGSTLLLPWSVPMKVAKEMLLTGRQITATRAYEVGLVNTVADDPDLLATATSAAELLATVAAPAASFTKQGINAAYELIGLWPSISHHSELLAQLGGLDMPEKREFLGIVLAEGVRAAVRHRAAQFAEVEQ